MNLKIFKILTPSRGLTRFAKIFLTCIGFSIIFASFYFAPNTIALILGISIGFLLVSLASYANKAESLDFPAPFTNDPLGWRKAKQSYHSKDEENGESQEADKKQ